MLNRYVVPFVVVMMVVEIEILVEVAVLLVGARVVIVEVCQLI